MTGTIFRVRRPSAKEEEEEATKQQNTPGCQCIRMRNVPLEDSSVGFEDVVGVALGTFVVFVMLISSDLVEGNSDTLEVGVLLFVAVG